MSVCRCLRRFFCFTCVIEKFSRALKKSSEDNRLFSFCEANWTLFWAESVDSSVSVCSFARRRESESIFSSTCRLNFSTSWFRCIERFRLCIEKNPATIKATKIMRKRIDIFFTILFTDLQSFARLCATRLFTPLVFWHIYVKRFIIISAFMEEYLFTVKNSRLSSSLNLKKSPRNGTIGWLIEKDK